jgi:hypothetical protein
MWYKPPLMIRRGLSLTLLVIFAVQLLGGMALASGCPDPCPDDAEGTGCPPICALCTSCTHAQTGIVQHSASAMPRMSTHRFVPQQSVSASSQPADDIFHVPLLG